MSGDWIQIEAIELQDFVRETSRVGYLVKQSDGTTYLIGDVNDMCGECDCCSIYREKIVAYKIVYEENEKHSKEVKK